ncbi:MAG: polysaccharide biosynthesis tyrosine autokinase [Kofleriaceae bacterium]|nr:polysaccharide biosynthesis tyrosine autokinase [Kofleriaceae bacterium]
MTPANSPLDPDAQEGELLGFDARRYIKALRRYVFPLLALVALAITGAVIYTSRQPRIYQARASVQIEPRLPDLLGQGENGIVGITSGAEYYKQQRQVLGSYTLIKQTVADHQLVLELLDESERSDLQPEQQLELATKRLQKFLVVKYPDQDRIMYVTVRSEKPELAAKIANDHISTYVAYSKGLLSTDTQQASRALQTEFEQVANKLQDSEARLFQYQKDNEILAVSLEDRQSLVSANITSYTARMNEARAARIELAAKLSRMKTAFEKDVLESPILMMGDSSSFDALRAQYYTERNSFLQIEKEIGPKNPEYQKQKAKVDNIYAALQSEARRIVGGVDEHYEAAVATERALAAEVERFKREAFELGPKIVAYNELLRTKKNWEDKYNILRSRLSTSEMTGRMNNEINSTYVKPLDPALVPTTPVSPSLRVNIAVAAVLALLLGISLVFAVVFLDRTVKTTTDAQLAAGVPVLGFIPVLVGNTDDKERDLYVHRNPKSLIAESCRALRTNTLLSAADRQLKTMTVCSANQREGKTTSVIYLGTTMAQSGQRVLLIDTDMRRPRLHASTGVTRQQGVTNLILGEQNYDEVIKATEIPNLFVLPCGPLPPNPAELLMTKRFETILAELATRFDRVILDSPPVQAVTDAVVLSKLVDGVILVVRADKTLREDVRRSANQIRDVGGNIFGLIVNEVDASDRSYYSYGYGYGYGYGAESESESAA